MTGPYRRTPRRHVNQTTHHVNQTTHQVGDILHVGNVRWLIQQITGSDVVLEASNASPGIVWRTTLQHLPEPTKELS